MNVYAYMKSEKKKLKKKKKKESAGQESEKTLFKVFVATFLCIIKTWLDVFSDLL